MAGAHLFPSYDSFLAGAGGMFRYLHEPGASSDGLCAIGQGSAVKTGGQGYSVRSPEDSSRRYEARDTHLRISSTLFVASGEGI